MSPHDRIASAGEPDQATLPQADPPRMSPEELLEQYGRYIGMTPERRDREIQLVCRTAMNQWLALPPQQRVRWPPEPGPEGDVILRRWMEDLRGR
ncbi:MAG: hypothetical protein HYZ53_22765 [Planctomycetes bacterium]|nr:hypothetical protein [Planctomycetota bacterium]